MTNELSKHKAKIMPRLLAGFFLLATCHAQDAPFWTKQQIAMQSINAGMRITDSIATCHALSAGGKETWLHSQSCAGTSAYILAGVPVSLGAAWLAHKTGHRKLALWMPAIAASWDGAALTYTFASWGGFPGKSNQKGTPTK